MPRGAGMVEGDWVSPAGGALSLCWLVWQTDGVGGGVAEARDGKAWKAVWMVWLPCVAREWYCWLERGPCSWPGQWPSRCVRGCWARGQLSGTVGPASCPPESPRGLAQVCHSHHWWVHTDPREGRGSRGPGGGRPQVREPLSFLGS